METLRKNDLAFFDSMSGLIPCKVLSISGKSGMASTAQTVTVKLTANHRPYKRGEEITSNGLHIVPRKAVHYRSYQVRIRAYNVEA